MVRTGSAPRPLATPARCSRRARARVRRLRRRRPRRRARPHPRRLRRRPRADAVFGSYDDAPADPHVVSRFRNLLHHHVHQQGAGPATTFWSGLGAIRRDSVRGRRRLRHGALPGREVEDVELGMRLHARGARIVLDPELLGTHLKRWTLREMVRTDLMPRHALGAAHAAPARAVERAQPEPPQPGDRTAARARAAASRRAARAPPRSARARRGAQPPLLRAADEPRRPAARGVRRAAPSRPQPHRRSVRAARHRRPPPRRAGAGGGARAPAGRAAEVVA